MSYKSLQSRGLPPLYPLHTKAAPIPGPASCCYPPNLAPSPIAPRRLTPFVAPKATAAVFLAGARLRIPFFAGACLRMLQSRCLPPIGLPPWLPRCLLCLPPTHQAASLLVPQRLIPPSPNSSPGLPPTTAPPNQLHHLKYPKSIRQPTPPNFHHRFKTSIATMLTLPRKSQHSGCSWARTNKRLSFVETTRTMAK